MAEETTTLRTTIDGREFLAPIAELPKILSNAVRITSATVSVSRKLNTGNYESEDFFQSLSVNFEDMWAMVPKEALADPVMSEKIQQIGSDIIMEKLAKAQLVCYRDCLMAILDRSRMKRMRNAGEFEEELNRFGTDGFDPSGMINKKKE